MRVCELSSEGPYVKFLAREALSVQLSEYSEDVSLGTTSNGVRCEDAQHLTYANETFDLVTHTEVLEHVPDDFLAFTELHRVLKHEGLMLFTVPFSGQQKTIERARRDGDEVVHLAEAVYHVDPWKKDGLGILAYRDYGLDIVELLDRAGFVDIKIVRPRLRGSKFVGRDVVVAKRGDKDTRQQGHPRISKIPGTTGTSKIQAT
jgi:SAM-dependent methyltransferase